jgi:hypothetical protein
MLPVKFIQKEIKNFVKPLLSGTGDLGQTLFFEWKKTVKKNKYKSVREANTRLRHAKNHLKWGQYDLANFNAEAINDYCELRSSVALANLANYPENLNINKIKKLIENAGKLANHGMELIVPDDDFSAHMYLRGIHSRICCPIWWRRKLKKAQKKAVERVARDFGLVNKYKGSYVSDISLSAQKKQAERNQKLLETVEAVNNYGEVYTLAELQKKGISNPEIRRAELMSRIRGFELMAEQQDHAAVFWTITCPSRFHSHNVAGIKNKKHNGETVQDAQKYLCDMWAAFRSWAGRQSIEFYGFRVAEPHHDGCPHWHILVFGDKKALQRATNELEKRALEVDGKEKGAAKNRFTAKWIESGETKDGRKLSAAGYIAKYISKSVDGFGVGRDTSVDADGNRFDMKQSSEKGADRVVGWARVHGIRQFQQIGGAYVSVWREIRKLKGECEDEDAREIVEAVEEKMSVDAAVAWAVFNMMNGSGDSQRLKLWREELRPVSQQIFMRTYEEQVDKETGFKFNICIEERNNFEKEFLGVGYKNQYGEFVSKIKGLVIDNARIIKTRIFEWTLVKKNEVGRTLEKVAQRPHLDLCQ